MLLLSPEAMIVALCGGTVLKAQQNRHNFLAQQVPGSDHDENALTTPIALRLQSRLDHSRITGHWQRKRSRVMIRFGFFLCTGKGRRSRVVY